MFFDINRVDLFLCITVYYGGTFLVKIKIDWLLTHIKKIIFYFK